MLSGASLCVLVPLSACVPVPVRPVSLGCECVDLPPCTRFSALPPAAPSSSLPPICSDGCAKASNGRCDDGGEGSETSRCLYGDDCSDCGAREPPQLVLIVGQLVPGSRVLVNLERAEAGSQCLLSYSTRGLGSTTLPTGITVSLAAAKQHPKLQTADSEGRASWTIRLPRSFQVGAVIFVQAAELSGTLSGVMQAVVQAS